MIWENVLAVVSGLSPLIAVMIAFFKPFKTKKILVVFEAAYISLFLTLIFFGGQFISSGGNNVLRAFSLSVYPAVMALLLVVFNRKFDVNRTLALTMMVGYLFTELHEVIGFIKLELLMFDDKLALKQYYIPLITPMDHLYDVVVGYLCFKIAKVRSSSAFLWWFSVGVFLEAIIYLFLSCNYDVWDYLRRLIWLPLIIIMFYCLGEK